MTVPTGIQKGGVAPYKNIGALFFRIFYLSAKPRLEVILASADRTAIRQAGRTTGFRAYSGASRGARVTWEKWQPNPRDVLIDKVRKGQLSPQEAEAEAEANGFGPIAETGDPDQFDPLRMPSWTLTMAVAWIAWRDATLVRKHCPDYRERCTHWVFQSWNLPTEDGKTFERIDGWALESWNPTTLVRLSMEAAYMQSTRAFPAGRRMAVADAEKELWTALEEGNLVATAKDGADKVVEIPNREWPYLQYYEESDQDVLKLHALDRTPTYRELKFRRADLMRLWQAWPIEAHMIEPMMRTGTAGYVPWCAALLWICTRQALKKET